MRKILFLFSLILSGLFLLVYAGTVAAGSTEPQAPDPVQMQDPTPIPIGPSIDIQPGTLPCDPSACLLYTSPSPRDLSTSRMPSSA